VEQHGALTSSLHIRILQYYHHHISSREESIITLRQCTEMELPTFDLFRPCIELSSYILGNHKWPSKTSIKRSDRTTLPISTPNLILVQSCRRSRCDAGRVCECATASRALSSASSKFGFCNRGTTIGNRRSRLNYTHRSHTF
jgi:hypothetical protein